MSAKSWAYVGVVIAEIFWAASFVFTQEALTVFSPVSVVVMRIALATLLLFIYCLWKRELTMPTRHELWLFALAGFFQPFLYFILEAYGLQYTGSPNAASLVLALGPLISPFVAWLLIRESITWYTVAGLCISAVGILIIVLVGSELQISGLGIALLAFAALTAVLYTICLRKISLRFKPATTVFWVDLTSLVMFIPTWVVMDHGKGFAVPTMTSMGAIIVLAVFCSVLCYIFFCNSVRFVGVARTNAFSNLIPAFTPLCVVALGGEMLAWHKYLGILIVIGGLFLSQQKPRK